MEIANGAKARDETGGAVLVGIYGVAFLELRIVMHERKRFTAVSGFSFFEELVEIEVAGP